MSSGKIFEFNGFKIGPTLAQHLGLIQEDKFANGGETLEQTTSKIREEQDAIEQTLPESLMLPFPKVSK